MGGKPVYLISIINDLKTKTLNETLNYLLQDEKQKLIMFLSLLNEKKVVMGEKTFIVKKDEILKKSQKDVSSKIHYIFSI